ncbi:MAG TPA: hypothetical protein VNF29_06585 [Candidatus Binataceae bacterium]|nr:hypothetical protein [Candidatus Binataceae bacterium]
MPLTDAQIERYSRQIIVPRVGGHAQERLLAARIILCGEARGLEPVLAYLAGAGAGKIALRIAGGGPGAAELAAAMRSLNPDSAVAADAPADFTAAVPNLVFAIIGGAAAASGARAMCESLARVPSVVARLDSPARIGVFPAPPPCPACTGDLLAGEFGASAGIDGVVVMLAAVEAFKLLAGYDPNPRAALIEFDGYTSHTRDPARNHACACASIRP